MAKFGEGDEIRLTRNMQFGNTQIRKNTRGTIKSIKKKAFGKNEYVVRWGGVGFDIIMQGEKDISPDGDKAYG